MKKIIEFEMDGQPVFVEAEATEAEGLRHVSNPEEAVDKATDRFTDAVDRIKPAAQTVLNAFLEMNTPDEIAMEFGIKFNAKAGVVFASADSEATFKIALKWTNPKEKNK